MIWILKYSIDVGHRRESCVVIAYKSFCLVKNRTDRWQVEKKEKKKINDPGFGEHRYQVEVGYEKK